MNKATKIDLFLTFNLFKSFLNLLVFNTSNLFNPNKAGFFEGSLF